MKSKYNALPAAVAWSVHETTCANVRSVTKVLKVKFLLYEVWCTVIHQLPDHICPKKIFSDLAPANERNFVGYQLLEYTQITDPFGRKVSDELICGN